MEERPRVKIVDYTGSTKVERTKIDEKMKELGIALRLDSFLDQARRPPRRRASSSRSWPRRATSSPRSRRRVEPLPGGPKLVKVVFDVKEGPKVKVRTINFNGNTAVSDGALARQMKSTKAHGMLSWITGKGTYKESEVRRRRRKGHRVLPQQGLHRARASASPRSRPSKTATTRKRAGSQLSIPIDEGPRYRVGEFTFDGNKIIKTEFLRAALQAEDRRLVLATSRFATACVKAREVLRRPRLLRVHRLPGPRSRSTAAEGPDRRPGRADRQRHDADARKASSTSSTASRSPATPRRATTSSAARCAWSKARRSTPKRSSTASSASISSATSSRSKKGQGIDVQKTPGEKNQVDVTLKLEEQNRNQLTFGAGVSQFEGFFGQLSFQTSNFLGRGEALTVSLQVGSRVRELPGRVHRAVPVRPQHHRRRRRLQAHAALHQSVHAGSDRRQRHERVPAGRLLAHVPDLQLRSGARSRT